MNLIRFSSFTTVGRSGDLVLILTLAGY